MIELARDTGPEWLRRIITEWRRYGAKAVCGVCDFIRDECRNAESWTLGEVKVPHFLKRVAESAEGMYFEIQTPIKAVEADGRAAFFNTLQKAERRRLIKADDVEATDKCLILVAKHLKKNGLKVSIATEDRELAKLCEELGINVRL